MSKIVNENIKIGWFNQKSIKSTYFSIFFDRFQIQSNILDQFWHVSLCVNQFCHDNLDFDDKFG